VTVYAFDGASPFDLAAAKANGAAVITGYVIGRPGGLDPISKARVDQILGMGLGFLPNAELAADFFNWCTPAQAQQMGADTAAACKRLGMPADSTVAAPASFDFDFTDYETKYQKLLAYGRGLVGFLPRAYGPQGFLDYITQPGRMPGTKHWLMMSTFNRPYNPASASVCMVQQHTLSGAWLNSPVPGTDVNTITDITAVHAWWPANSTLGGPLKLDAEDFAKIHADIAGMLSDPNHPYLKPLHDKIDALTKVVQPVSNGMARLSGAFDTGNPTPFSQPGELAIKIRGLANQQPAPTAKQIGDELVPRIPAAQATADVTAIVQGVMDGVLAKLPPTATKEEIVAEFRADIAANPFKIV
jgi:hypothetical protein